MVMVARPCWFGRAYRPKQLAVGGQLLHVDCVVDRRCGVRRRDYRQRVVADSGLVAEAGPNRSDRGRAPSRRRRRLTNGRNRTDTPGQAVNRFGTPAALELVQTLADIAQRQHLSRPTDQDTINQIDRLLRTGRHQQALPLSRRTRGDSPSAYRNVMFDNFDTIAHLHLGDFDAAASSLQRILDAAKESPHMRPQIELAAEEIGAALETTRAAWSPRSPRLTEQEALLRTIRRDQPMSQCHRTRALSKATGRHSLPICSDLIAGRHRVGLRSGHDEHRPVSRECPASVPRRP